MPKRLDVFWSSPAEVDLEEIIGVIAMDNVAAAKDIISRIRRRVERSSVFPSRGRIVPELRALGVESYREIILAPYRILFRNQDRVVWVLGIFDGRRDMKDVLLDRLVRGE